MTDLEILSRSLNELANIKVPVEFTEEIALPIYNVSNRLKLLYNAIIANIQKQKEAEEAAAKAAVETPEEEPETSKPGLRALTNAIDEAPENPNEEVPENVEQGV